MKEVIMQGRAALGIEFGSTRIKAVLIDGENKPIAQGVHEWENRFDNGLWTYSLDDIWTGVRQCYASLRADVKARYGVELKRLAAIGISGMMHGYMPFDKEGTLLSPFRTWRNTNTGEAAAILSRLFNFNIPLRWTVSHIYQAILNGEAHVKDIDFVDTLAGYVHWKLTGEKVVGVGEASGIFPIDPATGQYDAAMVGKFDSLLAEKGVTFRLLDIIPRVLDAGEKAGSLTSEGARLLDPTGNLEADIPFCPPEGDAGTGMVATNAVRPGTGNVSAGTSSFSMIVLSANLSKPYEAIDIVTTPDGSPVAMVHCNNCTSDINAWVNLFGEVAALFGATPDDGRLYTRLFEKAMEGDPDCGGLLAYNFFSAEPIVGVEDSRLLFKRTATDRFSLANFMRANLYSAVACLKIGNAILFNDEKIKVDTLMGHGGFFKTPGVGQKVLAAALDCPISVMETAGEGGAWGMAILAGFAVNNSESLSLADYLEQKVFVGNEAVTVTPDPVDVAGFDTFLESYKKSLNHFLL